MTSAAVTSFTIGVVGHRPDRLQAPATVAADIGAILDIAMAATAGAPVTLVSSLAEGADRIAAHQALLRGMSLKAVLPFDRDTYALDFPGTASDFHALLHAAAEVIELPGQRGAAPAAYEAAACEIVNSSALLLAVWDGGPSGGRGGTTETIALAARQRRPVIWVDALGKAKPVAIPPVPDLRSLFSRAAGQDQAQSEST